MFTALKSKIFGESRASRSMAKSRLHFVLVQDRTGLTAEEMTSFRKELFEVIQRYFHIEQENFGIDYKREGETTTLLINSPVVRKRQRAGAAAQQNGSQRGSRAQRRRRRAAEADNKKESAPTTGEEQTAENQG